MNTTTTYLHNNTVMVVGASSGIGRAVVQSSSRQGANVILSSRSADKLELVRQTLHAPEKAQVIPFDYRNLEEVRTALAPIQQIDHLVITAVADENAKRGRFVELSDQKMRASFDKFWGQVYVSQVAASKISSSGSITLFSSVSAFHPPQNSGLSVMNTVHAAVATLGKSLALELSPVRVNVVVPGVVLTNVWTSQQQESMAKWMETSLPSRHSGQPEDIAHAVLYLMTNRYATGTLHFIDGGLQLI